VLLGEDPVRGRALCHSHNPCWPPHVCPTDCEIWLWLPALVSGMNSPSPPGPEVGRNIRGRPPLSRRYRPSVLGAVHNQRCLRSKHRNASSPSVTPGWDTPHPPLCKRSIHHQDGPTTGPRAADAAPWRPAMLGAPAGGPVRQPVGRRESRRIAPHPARRSVAGQSRGRSGHTRAAGRFPPCVRPPAGLTTGRCGQAGAARPPLQAMTSAQVRNRPVSPQKTGPGASIERPLPAS
jgi:hypothetical protein